MVRVKVTRYLNGDRAIKSLSKRYSEEMTDTKRIAIAHLEKKLFPVANSVIYLDKKRNESRVTEAA